ncbi:uncharacterized protein N7515_007776 [Penicillium bovifimosum]|uniref:HAUS augmin-like complex subunit 6 N-terminal domain-containing protein n=1 Tax=Penicillium bovifimosum TaxID=126998 RepID=A0A9W9GLR5_9EURO|nr:uncharacterized protein N7515_007776 [Penicillium bovifimosum]KAJ5123951.1 hypothetical protein N7515_007776 [Penicillium bovifimosum]
MAATRPVRPKPLDWSGPSHLEVFIRNLKLLHLDQREDWPGISLRTLSAASQNQRQRTRLIEWALYRLYAIWDPEGALNKLRPFFPPLEPLQSVNLRAALFRCLGELKKNGDLGREVILRKTMLDDCKGEKFEELLAGFSTTVLRKLLAASTDEIWNPAMRLSTATAMTPTDYQNLLPLILAHQVSLSTAGERHARVQDAYDQFAQLLDGKKVELTERASREPGHSLDVQDDHESLMQQFQTNWLGSEEWATALLEGGSQSSTDVFLELPFSKALAKARDYNVDSLNSGSGQDLILDLEARVLLQRSRLHKWHEYNKSLSKGRGTDGMSTCQSKEQRMLFRDHQSLTVASISKAVRQPGDRGRMLKGADKYLLSSVNETLARINGKSRLKHSTIPEVRTSSPRRFEHASETVKPPTTSEDHRHTPSPSPEQEIPELQPESEPHTKPDSQRSPPTVRLSPDIPSDDEPEAEPIKRSTNLVERTRRSMSLLPPVAHDEPRRRRPRPSFPVNQFVMPRKASGQSARSNEISRASTPQDQLFEEDAEYASVFKSRPRVALSPISSPAVHVPSFEEESFELDYEEGERGEWGEVDSPSARLRG